jgi:putative Mg2+ transporter-C (MgtC) family protein
MGNDELRMLADLIAALVIGALIGLERSFHGRPAGFRTHALVCLASAALMLISVYKGAWSAMWPPEAIRIDPTRMAQGIMTGIGFLGAGVIFKEGLTIRGLTTAASIWVTAAIGILIGTGFYFPAAAAAAVVLGTLSVFRWIEDRMPSEIYALHTIKFERDAVLPEDRLRDLIHRHGFTIRKMSYCLTDDGRNFEYSMTIRTMRSEDAACLAVTLRQLSGVVEFRISRTGD